MLKRPVNVGFSGGEKKRNEMVQMGIIGPKLAILDETDSGLDIDALRVVGDGINRIMRAPDKAVVLITHYQQLIKEEGVPFRQAIVQGSLERLSPILMTALVTGVGLIPLALGVGQPGKEIQQPMAVVILGGIVTSTLLNMIVIPVLYLKFGRERVTEDESNLLTEREIAPEI